MAETNGNKSVAASDVRNGLVRVAVAYTGDFEYPGKGKFKITAADLESMREQLSEREVPIDYEHLSASPAAPPGWTKAAGWIRKPDKIEKFPDVDSRFRGNGTPGHPRESGGPSRRILWAWAEFTPAMLAMIKQKEYRYFSPEIHWSEKDEKGKGIGTVLKAAAITNRPFLKDLPPIEFSDADYQSLFGLAAREDGKLASIRLSERSEALVSLDQFHVQGPVNQDQGARNQEQGKPNISVAFEQPQKEKSMKSLKCKKLTDGEHKGKIGVFDGDEMIGLLELPEDWNSDGEDGSGAAADTSEDAPANRDRPPEEQFASEIGLPGRSLAEIAELVKFGLDAPAPKNGLGNQTDFVALAEAIHGGRINLREAGRLADAGKVRFSTILLAEEAEKKVQEAITKGKVMPKHRTHALRLALSDAAAFRALIEEARPVVDLQTRGYAGGGEAATAQQALMAEVRAFAEGNNCSLAFALSEVTKTKPELWNQYSEETVSVVETAADEE